MSDEFKQWTSLVVEQIKIMDSNSKFLSDKVEGIRKDVNAQSNTLVRNTATLEEHVRRTNLLEKSVEMQQERFRKDIVSIEGQIVAVQKIINDAQVIMSIVTPTKLKIYLLLLLMGAFGGTSGLKEIITGLLK